MPQLLDPELTISSTIPLSKELMPKPKTPLDIMNTMAGAAHQKAQPKTDPAEPDADDMPFEKKKKSPGQMGAIKAKGKNAAPKIP